MSLHPQSFIRALFKTFSLILLVSVVAGAVVGGILFFSITKGLPKVAKLKEIQLSHATEVLSADGKKIGEFSTEHRYPVKFESIPKHVLLAFIAAEDAKFYEHHGIDFAGIARAFFSNVFRGKLAQGASTITQQVARGLLLATRKKEITRKIREMVLAVRMEKQLSKAEILNLYLSDIYLGHGAYGIGAAAENYFHKKVEQLDLAEAALLAGLPQRPVEWDPFHNPYQAKKRQQYVLKQMVENGYTTLEDAKAALHEPLKLYTYRPDDLNNTAAPYFTEYVRSYLMAKYGQERVLNQGLHVYTTLRYDYQKAAEKAVDKGIRVVDKRLGWRGVLAHFDTPAKVDNFLNVVHEEVVDKLTPLRILPYEVNGKVRKLSYDLAPFEAPNSRYYGSTPLLEGEIYRGVVSSIDEARNAAMVKVGHSLVTLPVTGMAWVRVKGLPPKKVSQVVGENDAIYVKVEKIDKRVPLALVSLEQEPDIQGALLSYEIASGEVQSMVGGDDFTKNKFNCALQAKRQVGSTFKPVIYAAALDKGYSPSSVVTDSPIVFKIEGANDADAGVTPWRPHNYEGRFEGELPLRSALIHSLNVPTVKVLDQIGVDYGIKYARELGITAPLPRDLTIGLGSVATSLEEITRTFGVFPRLGKRVELIFIRKVVDDSGVTLEEARPNLAEKSLPEMAAPSAAAVPGSMVPNGLPPGHVISPQTAYVMTDMLKAVVREGTGIAASNVPAPVAGKTGTSSSHRDTWFIGYTPYVMTGVWIGYEKDKPLDAGETGGKAAAPVFVDYMTNVVKDYPKNDFPVPDNIVFAYIDKHTGRLATAQTQKRVRAAFKLGTVPNILGDNLPRIGEPGARMTTTDASAGSLDPGISPDQASGGETAPPSATKTEETSDFLRQGYQD